MNPHGPGPSHKAPPASDPLDRTRFPIDDWRLVETRFDDSDLGTTESLFSVGNGYLGLRGNYEESRDFDTNGTYVNGFHETWPILHAEEAFGFAKVGQTIVNAPDAKIIRLYVDDEPLELSTADLLEYERVLDLRTGVLSRNILWRTPSGKRVRVESRRMVSFTQRHLAIMTFEVTLLDAGAPVSISSQLLNRADGESEHQVLLALKDQGMDPRKAERFSHRVLVPETHQVDHSDGRLSLGYRCAQSGMTIAVAADHQLETTNAFTTRVESRRGHRQDDLPDPGRAGAPDPAHQDRQLPHRPRWSPRTSCSTAASAPSTGSARRACRSTSPTRRRTSPTSGSAATSRCRASRRSSRRCAGTSSRSSRPPRAPTAPASRRRG